MKAKEGCNCDNAAVYRTTRDKKRGEKDEGSRTISPASFF